MTPDGIAACADRSWVNDRALIASRESREIHGAAKRPPSSRRSAASFAESCAGVAEEGRKLHALLFSNGKLPCAPLITLPSGITRLWQKPQAKFPRSTAPLLRIT